jgi:ssDNA-binding Zn-finger/Zn-ribbon topoisomerase 1
MDCNYIKNNKKMEGKRMKDFKCGRCGNDTYYEKSKSIFGVKIACSKCNKEKRILGRI